jgi:hypothetical protein
MKDFDINEISRKFDEAPEEIQLFLSNNYIKQQLLDVARSFGAHIDKLEDYHTQIYLYLIGAINANEFKKGVGEALEIAGDQLARIITRLNNEFFAPLQLMYEDDEDGVYNPANKPEQKTPNMLDKKLKQSVISKTEEKNYSLKKDRHDPYREPID